MTQPAIVPDPPSFEEVQKGWDDLALRIAQLELKESSLAEENKSLRLMLETVIEHRQKSHSELVLLLTGVVSKLQINDIGVTVSKMIEHNTNVSRFLAALLKGAAEAAEFQPEILKTWEQAKRDLLAALKPVVTELIQAGPSIETAMLQSLLEDPDLFFTPPFVRANRCFIKGQVPRERVVREFGIEALIYFNDMTTDPKLNPSPKPEEIVLAFKPEFESLFEQNPGVPGAKREELKGLYQKVQSCKGPTEAARAQKNAFQKLSFLIELLHYYENQSTEAPDVIFAQRLPALIEQMASASGQEDFDEKSVVLAEGLIGFVINPDHRLTIMNNVGKGAEAARSLKYILRLRADRVPDAEQVAADFVRHLVPPAPQRPPSPEALAGNLKLLPAEMQTVVISAIMSTDRLKRDSAEKLGRATADALGLKLPERIKASETLPVEVERQLAWGKIKELITRRTEAATVATAIRERLNAKYDAEEIRQSWLTLIEADAISLIRIFSQIPYLPSGKTDPIARPVIETYVSRLTHEKYSSTYSKVMNSLRTMFQAKPDSPIVLNFLALVRWVDTEAAARLSRDIGMPLPV